MDAPLTRDQKAIRAVIIGATAIYLMVLLFFAINRKSDPIENDKLLLEHTIEKLEMQTQIDSLNQKIQDYEIKILQIRIDVNNLNNDQLDSVWSEIFD